MSTILLGLYDGYMSQHYDTLTSETKLGGRPTYFPPLSSAQHARVKEWTTCGVCGHSMYLLLQAYSPLPSAPRGAPHHRMIYVFTCNSSSCARQPSNSWAAFSVQVNQDDDNDGASSAPAEDAEDDLTQDGATPLPASVLPPQCFPPCHVYIEAEPAKAEFVPTALEKELIAKAEKRLQADQDDPEGEMSDKDIKELEETVDLKDKRSDYLYEKFRMRVARAPTQVLRYHQRPAKGNGDDENGGGAVANSETNTREQRPLFMNPDKVKRFIRVPACAGCGAALVHELQVMPTSLYYLRVSDYVAHAASGAKRARPESSTGDLTGTSPSTEVGVATAQASATPSAAANAPAHHPHGGDEGVDFATATVYVCSRDCAVTGTAAAANTNNTTLIHRFPKAIPSDATSTAPPTATTTDGADDDAKNAAENVVVVLRREFVCVESPPTLEEEKQEKKMEERARAGGAVRKDFREMLEAVESEDEDEDETEGRDNAAVAKSAASDADQTTRDSAETDSTATPSAPQ